MFRVPNSADAPTFDDTFKVGFVRWLTSKKDERGEWARRRNAAAKVAERNQLAKADAATDAARAERAEWKSELDQLRASGASRKEQMAAAKAHGAKKRSA